MKSVTAMLVPFTLLPFVFGANPYVNFCQEKQAVCKMTSGDYGCCPAANGVCCADGDHCCPNGFTCDLSTKHCLQYGDPALYVLTEQMLDVAPVEAGGVAFENIVSESEPKDDVENIQCPDASSCSDKDTCCLHISGHFACCNLTSANCCDNYVSCCPSGTVCDDINGYKCITPARDVFDGLPLLGAKRPADNHPTKRPVNRRL